MPTDSKATFDINIRRASYFLDIHEATQEGRGAPKRPRRELPRGAVVFAVGALDAYLSEVSSEVVLAQLQESVADGDLREVLRKVQSEMPTLALEVAVLSDPGARMARIRDAIVQHFYSNVSNHGAKAVSAAAARIGHRAKDLWSLLATKGFREGAKRLDEWTNKRHQIVHQGKTTPVRREQARKLIELVNETVETLDGWAAGCIDSAHSMRG